MTSRKKHVANPRSEFLSELMRVFGGDLGASAISAYKDNDMDRFRHALGEITDKLADAIKAKQNKVTKDVEYSAILKGGVGSGRHKALDALKRVGQNIKTISTLPLSELTRQYTKANEYLRRYQHARSVGFVPTSAYMLGLKDESRTPYTTILKGGVGSGKVGHKTVKTYARDNGHKTKNTSIGANYVKQLRNESALYTEHSKASKHLADNGFKELSPGLFEHSDGTQVRNNMSIENTRSGNALLHTLKVNEGKHELATPF